MRILHASHKCLPDQRVERSAYIAKNAGHEIIYLGMGPPNPPNLDVFTDIVMLPNINNRQVVTDKKIRKKWAEAVKRIRPDLIHANDLIAAVFSKDLGIPMVYDDHEYWSAQRIIYKNWPLWKRVAIRPFLNIIPEWEKEIVSNFVTITVSEAIAEAHRQYSDNVYVLQNFCLREEVQDLPINPNRSGLAYVGNDFRRKRFSPHRDMTGLKDWVKFDSFSGLPRHELYLRLTDYRYGLLPFKPNPYSKYANSAKTFDYLNCGLEVLMTDVLYEAHGELPFTFKFTSYSEIPEILKQHQPAEPEEIMSYAHRNLVWEAQADILYKTYSLAQKI